MFEIFRPVGRHPRASRTQWNCIHREAGIDTAATRAKSIQWREIPCSEIAIRENKYRLTRQ